MNKIIKLIVSDWKLSFRFFKNEIVPTEKDRITYWKQKYSGVKNSGKIMNTITIKQDKYLENLKDSN